MSHYDYPPRAKGGINPSGELRTRFKLYSNIRPCNSRDDLTVLRRPMDLIIVRENTEGFYSDRNMFVGPAEFMPDEDTALSIRKITAKACSAVAQTAFELARDRRRKVTAVHKANVLKLSDGLFLREVRKVAEQFPDVELEELIVDAAAAALIRRPDSFDVIVTTNMFGDILSDEASELSGSLGLGGSISVGGGVCVAQAQHGSAPDIAGRNVANPTSLILSASMLLRLARPTPSERADSWTPPSGSTPRSTRSSTCPPSARVMSAAARTPTSSAPASSPRFRPTRLPVPRPTDMAYTSSPRSSPSSGPMS